MVLLLSCNICLTLLFKGAEPSPAAVWVGGEGCAEKQASGTSPGFPESWAPGLGLCMGQEACEDGWPRLGGGRGLGEPQAALRFIVTWHFMERLSPCMLPCSLTAGSF